MVLQGEAFRVLKGVNGMDLKSQKELVSTGKEGHNQVECQHVRQPHPGPVQSVKTLQSGGMKVPEVQAVMVQIPPARTEGAQGQP